MIIKALSLKTAVSLFLCKMALSAESMSDSISFESQGKSFKLAKINAEDALSPKNPAQQEMVTFIRQVLEVPLDSKNLTGRTTSADGFLAKAKQTNDFMVVLYHDSTPLGFGRITKLSHILDIDHEGKMIPFAMRDLLTSQGLSLNAGYIIGGELLPSFRQKGYVTQVAKEGTSLILKNFLNSDENPYFYSGVFKENIPMNKIFQNVLKCEPINTQNDALSGGQERQSNIYVYPPLKK